MPNIATKEMTCLAALLRHSLFKGPLPPRLPQTEGEWQAVFDMAGRQAVTALAYDAILILPSRSGT